jgi:aconitate hydratase 2/2-methylisocitrate dehydratase
MITPQAQDEIKALQALHPDKSVMLIAEKGTMGVGSSRMSGVNNVALWTGRQASPYVPFVNFAPIVAGTNGISPIFLTTVDVTGGIGLDLKNWVKKLDVMKAVILFLRKFTLLLLERFLPSTQKQRNFIVVIKN